MNQQFVRSPAAGHLPPIEAPETYPAHCLAFAQHLGNAAGLPQRFYAWRYRSPAHARCDRELRVHVRASFEASRRRYGSPRVWEELLEGWRRVSHKRVVRLMQAEGLKAPARKRFSGGRLHTRAVRDGRLSGKSVS